MPQPAANSPPGLFITGVDTGVGKTYVTALIARQLLAEGRRVGVYKPAASGCPAEADAQEDATILWRAAGQPAELSKVCPQRFAAPLAPHLAARAESREVDRQLLRTGLEHWRATSDMVLVEGAGGLLSPLSDADYVADLAAEFGYPLVIVAANRLGTINATLQTLLTAEHFRGGLPVAAVVLNDAQRDPTDQSRASNYQELAARCRATPVFNVEHSGNCFYPALDWFSLAKPWK